MSDTQTMVVYASDYNYGGRGYTPITDNGVTLFIRGEHSKRDAMDALERASPAPGETVLNTFTVRKAPKP